MNKEDLVCEVCDSEFSIEHYEDGEIYFCPFCGESLFHDEEDDDWDEEPEEE